MFCGMLTIAKDSHVGTPVCMDWADANLVLDAIAIIDAFSCCICTAEDCKCNSCLAITLPAGHNDVHHILAPALHEA